jgi:pimeloyl-ACP methyl ester carboxylesterase
MRKQAARYCAVSLPNVTSVSASDGKPLSIEVWEKYRRDLDPKVFTTTGKVVLLAHGAGNSGRVVFDVQVPGAPGLTYSLMDYLAEQGFDVFTLAYQNYGRSDHHPCGLCVTTQVAAHDISAAVDHIRTLRGVEKVYLLGWSWGTSTAGLFTIQKPHTVRRLILYAPYLKLKTELKPPTTEFRENTDKQCQEGSEPEATDPALTTALCKEALQWDARSPQWCPDGSADADAPRGCTADSCANDDHSGRLGSPDPHHTGGAPGVLYGSPQP